MWYNGAGGDFLTHLLVVDDEVSILELIKNSLGKDGYLITVCQNADDVDIKKLHFYDLILLDVMMPGQTGILCAQNSPSSKTASGRSSAVASPVVKIHTRREFFNRSLFQIISLAGVSGACGQSHPGCRGACGISSAETACPRPPFQLCGFSGSAIAWGNSFRQPSRNSRRSGDGAEKMSSRSVGIKQ